MNIPKVYLAGPITGLDYNEGQDWRNEATELFGRKMDCFSPLRYKQYLRAEGKLSFGYKNILSTDRGIMARDHHDCMTSDLVFVNLLGAKEPSKGTIMEIAWAYAYRKPLVVVMEPEGNCHEHGMIREAIDFRVASLEHAVDVARAILLPGRLTKPHTRH